MNRPTKHIEKISEKYGVPISWAPESDCVLNICTKNMVKFHLIAAEMSWDRDLAGATMVMVKDAKDDAA